jgi:hypothetical protein
METEHKSFFRTRKVLALLPLAALAAVVFWYVSRYRTGEDSAGGKQAPPVAAFRTARPAAAAAGDEAEKNILALEIQGSPEFKRQVTGALRLILMADPDAFAFIKKCIYIVRNENKTELYLDNGQPVAAISNAHAFRSMPWCAGILAHQAFHSYAKFNSVRKQKFIPPSPGTMKELRVAANPVIFDVTTLGSALDLEGKASAFQAKVLAETGGSRAELKRVRYRDPRDFSAGHDGNYSTTL